MTIFFRKFSAIISALITAGLLAFILAVPTFLWWALGGLLLFELSLLWWMAHERLHGAGLWLMITLPVMFALSSSFLLMFLEEPFSRYALIAFSATVVGIVVHNIYTFCWEPHRYQPYAIENVSAYVNILSIFFFIAATSTLRLLTNVSIWYLAPVSAVIVFAATLQVLWAQKAVGREAVGYAAIFSLGTTEMFVAVSYLPARPLVLAVLIAVPYYFFLMLTRDWLRGNLDRQALQRSAVFSLLLIAVAVLTAQWQ